jgi:AbrB family looped-hinge helix DNA binding protein
LSKDQEFTVLKCTDDLGRIQIPKNIRQLLNIEQGEELEISVNTYYREITIKKIL